MLLLDPRKKEKKFPVFKDYKIIRLLRRRSQAYTKVSFIYDECQKWLKSNFINFNIIAVLLQSYYWSFTESQS